jgi:hypothetical protein
MNFPAPLPHVRFDNIKGITKWKLGRGSSGTVIILDFINTL